MRFLSFAVAFAAALIASQLRAQQPDGVPLAASDTLTTSGQLRHDAAGAYVGDITASDISTTSDQLRVVSPGEVTATPEMWFYEQALRRYDDPKLAFRAISAQKAADRRARLAAMKWYGLSNSRPQASIDVVHGPYSPRWIGNGYNPFQWVGPAGSSTMIVPVIVPVLR